VLAESFLLIKVFTCLLSVILATAVITRDSELMVNRVVGMVPICTALWSVCEIAWNLQSDPESAARYIRLSSLGWMLMGPICLHIFSEMVKAHRPILSRLVPFAYASAILCVSQYIFTDHGLAEAYRVSWGWSFEFGDRFIFLYMGALWPIGVVLAAWGGYLPKEWSAGERRIWRSIYVAVSAALTLATLTDVVLPLMGMPVMPMGSTSIAVVGVVVGIQFNRHGYSILSSSAFANEILETLHDGVVMLRANGRVRMVNSAFERLVGARHGKLIDVEFSHLLRESPSTGMWAQRAFESELVSALGERIPVLITPTQLRHAANGERGAALVVRDLREVKALRDRLVSSGRLAAVGEIASSLSEEIMEPTLEMRSHLEAMQKRSQSIANISPDEDEPEELLELLREREELVTECIEGSDRIASILEDVRGFSEKGSAPRTRVDLAQIINDALRIASAVAKPETRVEQRLGDHIYVECAPEEIVQVVVNLLVNAFQANEDGGRVRLVSTRSGDRALLSVVDQGPGIAPEIIDRIFDPFFTTKPVGDGTGLGLAICQNIVRQHGGNLKVVSDEGKGTTFSMILPLSPADSDGV
jgi:PAS domain S-box-containing protein